MKKLLLTLGLVSLMGYGLKAQLQVGDIAPNFTVTDINNQTHTLYDYLDQGYMVFIDISATWCGPCWSFSNSGIMKEVYEKYGPTGTITPKKIMVLFVEGDASTGLAELQGGPGSQGDWITGKPYPIIDDASLNANYLYGGFPSFTVVCPNKEVIYADAGASAAMTQLSWFESKMDECKKPVDGKNAALQSIMTPITACSGELTTLTVELLNFGTEVLTNAQITAKLGGVVIASQQWSGSLATFGTEVIDLGDVALDEETNTIVYEVTTANDAQPNDNILSQGVGVLKTQFRSWNIQAKTDNNPEQNGWNIKDEEGNVVATHNYTANDASKIVDVPIHLDENKCYTITVNDNGTDGITSGYIQIQDGIGKPIINVNGSYSSRVLKLKSGNKYASVNGITNVETLDVYPNPANDKITVSLLTSKDMKATLNVVDVLGRTVNTGTPSILKAGNNAINIDINSLHNGVYFINIVTEEGTVKAKFVKQ